MTRHNDSGRPVRIVAECAQGTRLGTTQNMKGETQYKPGMAGPQTLLLYCLVSGTAWGTMWLESSWHTSSLTA